MVSHAPAGPVTLDPRLNAYRPDLADMRLAGRVAAPRYAAGAPARIRVGRAPVHHAPDVRSSVDTFFHYGETVTLFDRDDFYAWCQGHDDFYVGYVAAAHVDAAATGEPTHYVVPLGAHAYADADLRGPAMDLLPRHSRVRIAATGLVTRGTEYAWLGDGLHLPLACLAPAPPRSSDLIAAARLYLGCPYLWGGRSLLGLDCSGLVQCAFRDLGMNVARDTDQQAATIGTEVAATDTAALEPGDLLYLPGHVLIHAGEGKVIHADGASMAVREEPLADFFARSRLTLAAMTVRRPAGATA